MILAEQVDVAKIVCAVLATSVIFEEVEYVAGKPDGAEPNAGRIPYHPANRIATPITITIHAPSLRSILILFST